MKSMSCWALKARYDSDTRDPTGAVMIQLQCSVTIAEELFTASNGVEMRSEPDRVTRVTETPGRQRRFGGGAGVEDAEAERDWDAVREIEADCDPVVV